MTYTLPKTRRVSRRLYAVSVELRPCATCDTPTARTALAPLNKDYTYEQAVQHTSFERDDKLCKCCRDLFETEHGREADDVYHVFDRGRDRND